MEQGRGKVRRLGIALAFWCLIGAAAFAGEAGPERAEEEAPIQASTAAPEPGQPAYGESLEPQRIIVTATRIPTAEGQVANSISVVTGQQIEERQYRNIDEPLRTVPGLSVHRSGGAGSLTGVSIRGMKSRSAKVLVDGMPMTDPSSADGSFDFGQFPLDNFGQLEVLRGAQSTLYGSSASAGVINLSSKKGEGPLTGYLSGEGGSQGTVRFRLGASAGNDKGDFALAGSLLRTDGISAFDKRLNASPDRDGYEYGNLALRLGANPTDSLRLDLFTNVFRGEYEYDSTWVLDDSLRTRRDRDMIRPKATLSLFDGRWEQSFGFGYLRNERRDKTDSGGSRYRLEGETYRFDYQSILRLHESNTILAGIDVQSDSMESQDPYYGPGTAQTEKFDTVTTAGIFLEDQFNFRDVLFATAGVRHEKHDDFGDHTTWSASLMVVLPTRTKLKASAGTGFNAPTLDELFHGYSWMGTPYFFANPDLQPETTFGWDAGFEQSFLDERLVFGASFFRNKIKNGIMPNDTYDQMINVQKYRTWGVESFVQFAVTENLNLSAQYTWLRVEDGMNQGDTLVQRRRPLNEFSVGLDWRFLEKGCLTAEVGYTGRRWDSGEVQARTVRMPSYTVARLGGSWKVNRHLEVFGRVENAFNKKYQQACDYGAERIGFFAGATLSF